MADLGHIAVYLPSLRGGGAERVMVELSNEFAARGHRVDLVLVKAEGRYLSEISPRVNVVDLNCRRVIISIWPLVRYLRAARPQAMLSALTHANLVALLCRRLANVRMRVVVSERNSLARLKGRSGRLFRLLIRSFYPLSDKVIAVSQGIARELEEQTSLLPQQVTTIPNPVNLERIGVLASEPIPHPWLVDRGTPTILAAGRLEPQKDYATLLSAFERVHERQDARLIILGEGSLRGELERRISASGLGDRVRLVGFDPNPFPWMAASQVYVLSSRHEGFPNSLVQAMACGSRVVSTDCPTGPDEILEGGKWGALAPVGRDDLLAELILQALNEQSWPDPRPRVDAFSIDHVVSCYLHELLPLAMPNTKSSAEFLEHVV